MRNILVHRMCLRNIIKISYYNFGSLLDLIFDLIPYCFMPPDKSAYLYFSSKTYVVGIQKKSFEHPKHMFKLKGKKIFQLYAYKISLSGSMLGFWTLIWAGGKEREI